MKLRNTLALALALALACVGSACVSSGTHQQTLDQLQSAQENNEGLRVQNEELMAENGRLGMSLEEIRKEKAALEGALQRLEQRNTDLNALVDAKGDETQALRTRLQRLERLEEEVRQRNDIYASVIKKFKGLIDAGQLKVSIERGRMVINLPQDILFDSGSATVSEQGQETLKQVASVLGTLERKFQVEGHTDNVPIKSARFPSNWELSSARAMSVVHLLTDNGVDPTSVSGAGYGAFQPAASNDSPEGKKLNRRIEIVMIPNLDLIAQTKVN